MLKMRQCYTCGYEERNVSRVVYCVHCQEAMVHRYCMDPPRHGDEEFDWVCEECCPRVIRRQKSYRKSEILSLKLDSEVEKRNSGRRLKKFLGHRSHGYKEDANKSVGSLKKSAAEVEELQTHLDICDDQTLIDEELPEGFTGIQPAEKSNLHSVSNYLNEKHCELKAKESFEGAGRTAQKEDSALVEEVVTRASISGLHKRPSSLIHDSNAHVTEKRPGGDVNKGSAAHQLTIGAGRYQLIPRVGDGSHKIIERFLPISDVSWRGSCLVTHEMHKMSFELEAHLSNSANFKVSDAVRTLPLPLDLELVDKFSEWPKRFFKEPPTGDDIGLYLFPFREGDRKVYDDVLGKMIVGDLVLRFTRNDLRLLVFCSLDLPNRIQRFDGKFYLWGVFCSPLSVSSSEKGSVIPKKLVPGNSSGSSCLEEDVARNTRCSPTGGEVQSIPKVQGSLIPVLAASEERDEDGLHDTKREQSLCAEPQNLTTRTPGPRNAGTRAVIRNSRDGLQNIKVHSDPDNRIEGVKDSARIQDEDEPIVCARLVDPRVGFNNRGPDSSKHEAAPGKHPDLSQSNKKRKCRKDDFPYQIFKPSFSRSENGRDSFPNQGRKSNFSRFGNRRDNFLNQGRKPVYGRSENGRDNFANQRWKPNFNRSQSGNVNHQHRPEKQSFRKKQKQMRKQKQSFLNRNPPEDKAAKPGSRFQAPPESNPHHQPHAAVPRAEQPMPMNQNWNKHANPQPYASIPEGKHTMPMNENSSMKPHPCPQPHFPEAEHAMPMNGNSGSYPYPQPHASFPEAKHTVLTNENTSMNPHPYPQPHFPKADNTMSTSENLSMNPHPYPQAHFPEAKHGVLLNENSGISQHPHPWPHFAEAKHGMPMGENSHTNLHPYPRPRESFPEAKHAMLMIENTSMKPPLYPKQHFPEANHTMPMNGNLSTSPHSYPKPYPCVQPCPSFAQHQVPMNNNLNRQSHPPLYSSFPIGQHVSSVNGNSVGLAMQQGC